MHKLIESKMSIKGDCFVNNGSFKQCYNIEQALLVNLQ